MTLSNLLFMHWLHLLYHQLLGTQPGSDYQPRMLLMDNYIGSGKMASKCHILIGHLTNQMSDLAVHSHLSTKVKPITNALIMITQLLIPSTCLMRTKNGAVSIQSTTEDGSTAELVMNTDAHTWMIKQDSGLSRYVVPTDTMFAKWTVWDTHK